MRIVQSPGQGFSLVQVSQGTVEFPKLQEHTPQAKPQIDGLLDRVAALRQVLERY